MKSRVIVSIAGQEYTLIAEDDEAYVLKVASFVDSKVREISEGGGKLRALTATTLAAVNVADEYFKALDAADHLRVQLKEYIEEVSRAKSEVSEARRELTRLRKGQSEP